MLLLSCAVTLQGLLPFLDGHNTFHINLSLFVDFWTNGLMSPSCFIFGAGTIQFCTVQQSEHLLHLCSKKFFAFE